MFLTGYIHEMDEQSITIVAPFNYPYLLAKREVTEVEIKICDGRKISPRQKNKIFAMIRDITRFVNGCYSDSKRKILENETLRQMQLNYLIDVSDSEEIRYQLTQNYCNLINTDLFSLSNIDMTTARGFISYLIELCLQFDIPCQDTLLNRCEDVEEYVYLCLKHKKCCITGEKCELHHVDAVGSGRDRKTIIHEGMRVLPLNRIMHNKIHSMGNAEFCKLYHVEPIKLDKYLCEIFKLRSAT